MNSDRILLGHGGGGSLMQELIGELIVPALNNPRLQSLDDSAVVEVEAEARWLAFTTDGYVVHPHFFPGGDIGKLAVCGTVNDLAAQGAQPLWLSVGLIIEEGFPINDLRKVLETIRNTADEAGIEVVTGDTKVVERGHGDGLFITTSGVGRIRVRQPVSISNARVGDAVIVSGALGEHGIAVLSQREGLGFATSVQSDCAPLWGLVETIIESGAELHALRDPTRGGLAATLCEMTRASGVGMRLQESALPIAAEVRGACDLLGLDPLTIANEGKLVVVCTGPDARRVLEAMRNHPLGQAARIIGQVTKKPKGMALLETVIGGERIIDQPTGEDLPRIC